MSRSDLAAPLAFGAPEHRPLLRSMGRGALCRCPACGTGRLFRAYLKVADRCEACGEELHHQRADDAPPYFVMFIVGHVVIAACLAVEIRWHPAFWIHFALWLPLTVVMTLGLLPVVKGAIVALQWANRMHGFGGEADDAHMGFAGTRRGHAVRLPNIPAVPALQDASTDRP